MQFLLLVSIGRYVFKEPGFEGLENSMMPLYMFFFVCLGIKYFWCVSG